MIAAFDPDAALDAPVVLGLGRTGGAMVAALRKRGFDPVVVEDRPREELRGLADQLGVSMIEEPAPETLRGVVERATVLLPSPGVPDGHPAFALAAAAGVAVNSEFDLSRRWDERPIAAVTATNGKTTVTMLAEGVLTAAGKNVTAAGNTDVPLVTAIDDPNIECFVVEASSFRLGHTARWSPQAAAWLNFAPDHLDVHADLAAYEQAKARLWRDRPTGAVAIADLDDPVVAGHAPADAIALGRADYRVEGDRLIVAGTAVIDVDQLWSPLPHDRHNALAAAAMAVALGADLTAVSAGLAAFPGLPHRVQLVAERDGVRWYDDSKATTPHATRAAVAGFESVVLIAGGRNKGVDLGDLVADDHKLRLVVAIGEAGAEVEAAFAGRADVIRSSSMAGAVEVAADSSRPGDAVLLSPGCASFDWYESYADRGDDFAVIVLALLNGASS